MSRTALIQQMARKRKPGAEHQRLEGAMGQHYQPRITEDDPRWNPNTMGNRRGRKRPRTFYPGRQDYVPLKRYPGYPSADKYD